MKVIVTWVSIKREKYALIGIDILGDETVEDLEQGPAELVFNDQEVNNEDKRSTYPGM
jgi:hypothetical protein